MSPTHDITGKDIRIFRHKVLNHMPEPKFAALLTRETGEQISSNDIIRFEAYKKTGAASPKKPSLKVREFVYQRLSASYLGEGDFPEVSDTSAHEKSSKESSAEKNESLDNSGDSASNWRDGTVMTIQEQIKEIVSQYKEIGLDKVDGDTASEMVANVKSKIRSTEQELIGKVSSGNRPSEDGALRQELAALEEEEARINEELEKLNAELAAAGTTGSSDSNSVKKEEQE